METKSELSIDLLTSQLLNLFESQAVRQEIYILGKTTARLKIRLRNADIVQRLLQLGRLFLRLRKLSAVECLRHIQEDLGSDKIDYKTGTSIVPSGAEVDQHQETLSAVAQVLHRIAVKSSVAFGHCMPWIKLGHLIPHFLVLSSALSRVNIIAKAMITYCCDLYSAVAAYRKTMKISDTKSDNLPESIEFHLDELSIKRFQRSEQKKKKKKNSIIMTNMNNKKTSDEEEDFGVLLSRTPTSKDPKNGRHQTPPNQTSRKRKKNKNKKSDGHKLGLLKDTPPPSAANKINQSVSSKNPFPEVAPVLSMSESRRDSQISTKTSKKRRRKKF